MWGTKMAGKLIEVQTYLKEMEKISEAIVSIREEVA